ncbi:ribonuclease H-like domain-containing protein [Tanacetum coccineum]
MTDYSLWEVILNSNKVLKNKVGETKQEYKPTTAEEKQERRNEMKARGTLLMALPNKDQLKFHAYKYAKLLMEAIEKRYGGNKESKKSTRDSGRDNTAYEVSTTTTQSNVVNATSLDYLSDAMICAFLEIAMLTIRSIRFIKRTGRKMDLNGQRVGFDRSKVECFNCHKNDHFARDCRFLRNQEIKGRDNGRETRRKIITVEIPTDNALIAQDKVRGYDWIYLAEEEQPTNFALMASASSGGSSSSDSKVDSYLKSCVKAFASLKEQYDSLNSDYNKSQFNLLSYKAG